MTRSMKEAIRITAGRRRAQQTHNRKMGIVPKTISSTGELMATPSKAPPSRDGLTPSIANDLLIDLERDMRAAAAKQEFELAARYRDEIKSLKEWLETAGE
jgi:excinuclease ABC subunit B